MNATHAADALLALLVTNVADVNTALAGTGYTVSTDAGTATGDTSPYRYIKRGDRVKLPDGLTVCFVAGESRKINYFGPNVSEKEVTVQIVAYLMDEHDPHAREGARGAVADALRSLYNRTGNRTVTTDDGSFYDCEVTGEQFRYFERMNEAKMGQIAAGVLLSWRGLTYVQETTTDG